MHRKKKPKNLHMNSSVFHENDMVLLWIMRILVLLGGYRQFANDQCIVDEELAIAIGMGHWVGVENFDDTQMLNDLRSLHGQVEHLAKNAVLPSPLTENSKRLAHAIGLNETETRIIEFATMMHSNEMLQTICSDIQDYRGDKFYFSLSQILDIPIKLINQSLSRNGKLYRSSLLSNEYGSRHSSFSERLKLLSDDFPDQMLTTNTNPTDLLKGMVVKCDKPHLTVEDFSHIKRAWRIIYPYIQQALDNHEKGINILLYGKPGVGKSQFARLIAKETKSVLFEIAREQSDGGQVDGLARMSALKAANHIVLNKRSLILFDEFDDALSSDYQQYIFRQSNTKKSWINQMLEENSIPTIWVSNDIFELDNSVIRRFDIVLEMESPPIQQRKYILKTHCQDLLDERAINRIATHQGVTPAHITRATKVIKAISSQISMEERSDSMEYLIGNTLEAQRQRRPKKNDANALPDWYEPAFINTDVDLLAIAEGLKQSKNGRICLYGPPGTGKTAYGRWLADTLEMPLHTKRASDLISPYIGETEASMAMAFREAENDGALLLIDEVDSFLQDRRNMQRSWEVSQVNEMLTQMESFNGVFVASTNLMTGLDQASLRRFDLKLNFRYMTAEQAWRMYLQQCHSLQLSKPDDSRHKELSSIHTLTPGDFAAIARQHRFQPLSSPEAMLEALKAECAIKEDANHRPIGFVQ